jgi:hypothetical protein
MQSLKPVLHNIHNLTVFQPPIEIHIHQAITRFYPENHNSQVLVFKHGHYNRITGCSKTESTGSLGVCLFNPG